MGGNHELKVKVKETAHPAQCHKKMEDAHHLLYMLILLFIRSTEGTPLGVTEKTKADGNLEGNQMVTPPWQKDLALETKNISGVIGKEVTLVVDTIKKSDIQDIQWVKYGVNFATTKPRSGVTIRESRYDGRLSSSDDGSLIIHHLVMDDHGEYKADILMVNMKKYEILYILHISEEGHSGRTHVTVSVIIALLVVIVIVAGAIYWLWKSKKRFGNKRRNEPRGDPEGKPDAEEKVALQEQPRLNLPVDKPDPKNNHNQQRESSADPEDSIDESEYSDALESQEKTESGHTS